MAVDMAEDMVEDMVEVMVVQEAQEELDWEAFMSVALKANIMVPDTSVPDMQVLAD